jgi:hypothetical protein
VGALLYWFRIGLAAFLAFAPPVVRVDGNMLIVSLGTEHVLTQEMRELVEGGVPLSFELYCSAKPDGGDGGLSIWRVRRSIRYDYLRESFIVNVGDKVLLEVKDIDSAEASLRRYDGVRFELKGGWTRISIFAELRSLGDPLLSDRFGKDGASLWGGYRPSVKVDISKSGATR